VHAEGIPGERKTVLVVEPTSGEASQA